MNIARYGSALVVTLAVTGCGHEETRAVEPAGTISSDPWWMERTPDNDGRVANPTVVRNPFALDGDGNIQPDEPVEPAPLPGPPPLALQGVVAWAGNTMAVIDGKQYRLGEVVKHRERDWTVVGIAAEPPSATLRWSDGEHEVESTLLPQPVTRENQR